MPTCGSWNPADSSCERMASTFAAEGSAASTDTPPVKSIAKLSPFVTSAPIETTIITAESAYHTLRVRMNAIFVCLWKNSMSCPRLLNSADRELADLRAPAVHQGQQCATAHERREHRGRDTKRQHDREAADRAGTKHP